MTGSILFYLNGKEVHLDRPEPDTTIIQYVRSIGLTGTKLGCGEGGCGACTVMLSEYSPEKGVTHRAVNGCLYPLCAVDGAAITTIEGLGSTANTLSLVQERIALSNGSQCGFCTPGIVVALYAYLRSNPGATAKEIEENMDGNLCRCTGYRPILDAAKSFGSDLSQDANLYMAATNPSAASGSGICPSTGQPCACAAGGCGKPASPVPAEPEAVTYHFIFPPALKSYIRSNLHIVGSRVTWIRPMLLSSLLATKSKYPDSKLVVGNTEVGVEVRLKAMFYPTLVDPTAVPELKQFTVTEEGVEVGASMTLTELSRNLDAVIATKPAYKTRSLVALRKQIRWFASNQIRNAACIGGNICTASPISDLNPVLVANNAALTLNSSRRGPHKISLRSFFIKYRVVRMDEDEILQSVFIPFTRETEYFNAYKQARRRDDDIAIVTCGVRVLLEPQESTESTADSIRTQWVVQEIGFGYGGMAPKTVFCINAEQGLVGLTWDEDILPVAYKLLEKDLPLPPDAPGGMIQYRRSLTTSFFYKFFLHVLSYISPAAIPRTHLSVLPEFEREVSFGSQSYQVNPSVAPITHPVVHSSALKQVTGEAVYTDDLPQPENGCYAAFVMSSVAHGRIVHIDAEPALAEDGVIAFVSAKDVPGHNKAAPDEELFASNEVKYCGQPIGLILAKTHREALAGARLVRVEYEKLPHILTIQEAIEQKSFFNEMIHSINDGNVEAALQASDFVISGSMEVGGQEHFYLEPNVSLAIPSEDGEMKVIASTQNPTHTQDVVADALGVGMNRVTVAVKRLGGGFGGKETRSIFISAAAAVAARVVNRPVRLLLDRDTDMTLTGGRHPFLGKYRVGVDRSGKVNALDIQLFSNGGWSLDLSGGVMDRALFHTDNSYKIPHLRCIGYICRTNVASNTAFRGFGGPQSMLICEAWMEHVARELNMPLNQLREINFYKEGDATHYHQVLPDCHIQRMWHTIVESSEYHRRLAVIEQFNKENRWKKRGIALVPTKFGMSFTVKFLNQAAALVHVYKDGSVLVSHGGTEMGQGLHTKVIQVASRALGVPMSQVYINETATDKVANTSPTAASVSSDLNCMAVKIACEKVMARLLPLMEKMPNASFSEVAKHAYFNKVDLCAHGYFEGPPVDYVFGKGGTPFNYFCWGVSCSEVEIDVLTGDYQILRADILMDVGDSLNPAIDIGQVEGAYVQGVGWCTLEEVVHFNSGHLFTKGPGSYKIPSFGDVPVDFRVSLLNQAPNPRAIHSSKGVGEPPFFLSTSVFFAIKEAIYSAREDASIGSSHFCLLSPATSERIRLACEDSFTLQFSRSNGTGKL